MPNQSAELGRVFQALADPTRRAVLERLAGGPAAMSELAQPFRWRCRRSPSTWTCWRTAAWCARSKEGRVRTYRIAPQAMKAAEGWLSKQRALWTRRLDQFDAYVKEQNR